MQEFDFRSPPTDPVELANNLIETMVHNRGLGLSANQCGLPYRAFVLWSEKPLAVFNPRVVDRTSEFIALEEGCLTYPHLFVKVKRPKAIKVRFENEYGEIVNEKFAGMTARCFLHEMDHLDGVVFLDRANKVHLSRALNQQKNLLRALKRGEAFIKPSEMPEVNITGLNNV
jgi:peptide deformylase